MHILFLSHYFPPEVNAPASRTYEHARRWAQAADVRVTVITNHPNHPQGVLYPGYVNRWLTREEVDGIEVKRVKTYVAANAGVFRRTLNYLFFMIAAILAALWEPTPDILVATSPQFFCALAGYVISVLKGCPFVFELRDIWPESIVTVGAMRPGLAIRLLKWVELFLYRRSAHIVALTDAFRQYLLERGIVPEKISVLRNGVDLSFFVPQEKPHDLLRSLNLEEKFVASYIGTIGMAHGIDRIVAVAEALKNHSEIVFLIVGEGAEKRHIEGLVAQRRLPNLRILPGVSKEQIRGYYAISDLLLVTLRQTPLFRMVIPSKIFEIMAMARPMLYTVDGECRTILNEAGSGIFVEPENVKEMVQALSTFSQDRVLLARMGKKGRRFVEQTADRNRLADRYLQLLQRIVGQRSSS